MKGEMIGQMTTIVVLSLISTLNVILLMTVAKLDHRFFVLSIIIEIILNIYKYSIIHSLFQNIVYLKEQ